MLFAVGWLFMIVLLHCLGGVFCLFCFVLLLVLLGFILLSLVVKFSVIAFGFVCD